MKTHIETPKNGRSQPKPARFSSVTGTPSSRSRAAIDARTRRATSPQYGIR